METQEEIIHLLNEYVKKFPNESEGVKLVVEFVKAHQGEDLFSRKNYKGHITGSAFIIDPRKNALLMIKHKTLDRWLQPGGHVDAEDTSLIEAAFREVQEETGIQPEEVDLINNLIFDIDSHIIPLNSNKNEPEHCHHDLRFLFVCKTITATNNTSIGEFDLTERKWIQLYELQDNSDFRKVADKILQETGL